MEQDIIEKVSDEPTPWISPIVCTPKKTGGLRLCVYMREANTAIQRERHLMPTIADFKAEVNNYSRHFSKSQASLSPIGTCPESRYITTFSTHEGLYRYKRLNYGTTSAAEIYQNILQQHLSDIRGVKNIADDVLIHGPTPEAQDKVLESCLQRFDKINLKDNGEKCAFLQKEIKFYGLIFSAAGTKPDPARITKLVKLPPPKNAGEVGSLLGMTNACQDYIPDYAKIATPLRELTKKNAAFNWTNTNQKAFELLKKRLTQIPVMSYFDTQKRSMIIVDGSPYGISAIFTQREHNSSNCHIEAYASRALTPVERRYTQTDIEGLALIWGIEHFRLFVLGAEFDIITDHKALESIYNNPRSTPTACIQRWMMPLQPYHFSVIYKKGSSNESDYMSRHPNTSYSSKSDTSLEALKEHYINFWLINMYHNI